MGRRAKEIPVIILRCPTQLGSCLLTCLSPGYATLKWHCRPAGWRREKFQRTGERDDFVLIPKVRVG